jgi:hypothetical protein
MTGLSLLKPRPSQRAQKRPSVSPPPPSSSASSSSSQPSAASVFSLAPAFDFAAGTPLGDDADYFSSGYDEVLKYIDSGGWQEFNSSPPKRANNGDDDHEQVCPWTDA